MKKMLTSILTLCLIAGMALPIFATAQEKSRDFLMPTGTFIQYFLFANYSDSQLDAEFKKMKDMGIDTIYFSNMAERNSPDEEWVMTYPTKAAEYATNQKRDEVTRMMKYCKKYGIKFYLGLGLDGSWWNRDLSKSGDAKWMMDVADMSCFIVKDAYAMYEEEYGDVFGGYYWVYEIWNHNSWNNATTRSTYAKNLAEAFNKIIDCINKTCPEKTLWFSPFATRTGFATKENLTAFYTEFFKKTRFRAQDAMAPMDNIGGGGQILSTLEEWTKAYSDAFKNSGTKLQFWSNCESFVQPKGTEPWASCTMDRFEQQLRITSKYCSKIVTFSYNHYHSASNTAAGFDKGWKDLATKGELEKVKPTLPTSVTVTYNTDSIVLTWNPFTDDYDIAKYALERYNASTNTFDSIKVSTVGRKDGKVKLPALKTTYTDTTFIKGKDVVYRLSATDCSGNVTDPIYFLVKLDDKGNAKDFSSITGAKGYLTTKEYEAYAAAQTSKPTTSETTSQTQSKPTENSSTSKPESSTASKPADEVSSEWNNSSATDETNSEETKEESSIPETEPSSEEANTESETSNSNAQTDQLTNNEGGNNTVFWIVGGVVVLLALLAAAYFLFLRK